MDELKGYLQCFDENDREDVRVGKKRFVTGEDIQHYVLANAIYRQKPKTLHTLLDIGIGRTTNSAPQMFNCRFDDEVIKILYDRGIHGCVVRTADKKKLQRFLQSRDCARKAAIVVMGAAKGTFGGKDVARIIGRAIWALRGE